MKNLADQLARIKDFVPELFPIFPLMPQEPQSTLFAYGTVSSPAEPGRKKVELLMLKIAIDIEQIPQLLPIPFLFAVAFYNAEQLGMPRRKAMELIRKSYRNVTWLNSRGELETISEAIMRPSMQKLVAMFTNRIKGVRADLPEVVNNVPSGIWMYYCDFMTAVTLVRVSPVIPSQRPFSN